ncbi:MAG: hypothetical protein AAGJ82_05255 [Bacteroidota bacterium]
MTKWFFQLLIGLSCVAITSAQEMVVSEEISINADLSYDLIGEYGEQILLFRNAKTNFKIHAFNAQMRASWDKELVLDKRLPKVLGILPTPEDFSLIYSYRKRNHTHLKVHRYDPAANLIDSTQLLDLGYLFYTPNFQMIRSEDRSKLLLYFTESQTTVHTYVFDTKQYDLLWEYDFAPEDFNLNRDFSQIVINNKGEVSFILQKNSWRSRNKQHYYDIHTYDGSKLVSHIVPMRGKETYDVIFEMDNLNDQLVAGGLYAENNSERSEGYFYFKLDPLATQVPDSVRFRAFHPQFLETFQGRDYRKGRGLTDTDLREFVLRRDGGILLVGERNRQLQRRTNAMPARAMDPAGLRGMVDFYFEEVFVLSIHPDGQQHWNTIMHKKQYSQDDAGIYSSYFLFKSQGLLRFLFNDEIRAENTVSEYILNGLGKYDRNSIFSTANLDLRLRFQAGLQTDARTLVVPSERRNRLKLVKLVY